MVRGYLKHSFAIGLGLSELRNCLLLGFNVCLQRPMMMMRCSLDLKTSKLEGNSTVDEDNRMAPKASEKSSLELRGTPVPWFEVIAGRFQNKKTLAYELSTSKPWKIEHLFRKH